MWVRFGQPLVHIPTSVADFCCWRFVLDARNLTMLWRIMLMHFSRFGEYLDNIRRWVYSPRSKSRVHSEDMLRGTCISFPKESVELLNQFHMQLTDILNHAQVVFVSDRMPSKKTMEKVYFVLSFRSGWLFIIHFIAPLLSITIDEVKESIEHLKLK